MRILDFGRKFGMGMGRTFDPWHPEVIEEIHTNQIKELITKIDLIVFGGGGDIHPSMYNQQNVNSRTSRQPSLRDNLETFVFKLAVDNNVPMFGICRGAQLVCALSGGDLYQDVNGHGHDHQVITSDKQTFNTSSLHHQMLQPINVTHELLAWSTKRQSSHYSCDTRKKLPVIPDREPEVVFFPETRALAVQGHPEFMPSNDNFVIYCRKLCITKLFDGVPIK